MQLETGNRFQKFKLDEAELKAALAVNPYFYAYLQNKIADYAMAVVESTFNGDKATTVLDHEKLKAQVEVLEELMRELQVPLEQSDQRDPS